jgi:uncharacterized protein HemX
VSDEPTRRLPPARPPVGGPEVAYVHPDEALWREHIFDRLRSLTTGVTLVAIVAVAGLGVGLWALLTDEDDNVSGDRISRLEQRVESLDSRLRQRPAADDLAALRAQQRSLDERVRALEERTNEVGEAAQGTIEAVDATQQSVADLEQRVAQLEQSAP